MTERRLSAAPLAVRDPRYRVDRRAVWWWTIKPLVSLGSLLLALVLTAWFWEAARPWLAPVIAVATVVLIVLGVVAPRWRYAVHRWETTENAVYGLTGWYVREWRVAPMSRIQTVDSVRGPLEQMMGLATLRVTTASSQGAISIVGLDAQVAARVAEELSAIVEETPGDGT